MLSERIIATICNDYKAKVNANTWITSVTRKEVIGEIDYYKRLYIKGMVTLRSCIDRIDDITRTIES